MAGNLREVLAAYQQKSVAVPVPSKTITLRPLKAVGNLQERYSEATADVIFVGRERLPAHRAVLSVASAVFFRMFEGDWRESRERSIPAPPEYNWEAFKAAITLLYGVEVQVDESSILDVFRVAHCYGLGYVKVVLAHAISQWGRDMLDTVLELCALVGQLETEEDQKEHEMIEAGAAYVVKHLALVKAKPTGLNALPYQAVLKVVQSEYISVPEVDVFLLLNQWIKGRLDITIRQAQHLYSHIRYGIIPYESLSLGVNQENLTMTLQNHQQLSTDRLKDNLKQITPRLCQKEVLQVYPLVAGLSVSRKSNKWEFMNVAGQTQYSVGIIFSGRHELTCQMVLKMKVYANSNYHLCTELSSLCKDSTTSNTAVEMTLADCFGIGSVLLSATYLDFTVILKSTGAFLVSESREYTVDKDTSSSGNHMCKNLDLPFEGPFPWILKFRVLNKEQQFGYYAIRGYSAYSNYSAVPRSQPISMLLHCE